MSRGGRARGILITNTELHNTKAIFLRLLVFVLVGYTIYSVFDKIWT